MDYCETVYDFIIVPILLFLMILNILIIYYYDAKSKKFKNTNRFITIGIFLITLNFVFDKFYRQKSVLKELSMQNGNHQILLYENKSAEIIMHSHHVDCHYMGKFELSKDKYLKISAENLINKTNIYSDIEVFDKFNNKYILQINNN